MLTKARIIVEGLVQGVGYRALIKQIATYLDIRGFVRNMDHNKVEILCDGSEERISELLREIDVKGEKGDYMSVNVMSTRCYRYGEEGYKEPERWPKDFQINYGIGKVSQFELMLTEDLEYGKMHLSGLRREFKAFRENTSTNFRELDNKYGSISKELREFRKIAAKFVKQYLEQSKGAVKK